MSHQAELFDDPIAPPCDGMVLRVVKWPYVFETCKSRGYQSLNWIALENTLDSHGIMAIKRRFSDRQMRREMLLHWHLLLFQVSRQRSPSLRGYLCGDRHEQWDAWTICENSDGFGDQEMCEVMLRCMIEIGWLEWAQPGESYPEEKPKSPPGPQQGPAKSSPGTQQGRGKSPPGSLPDITEPDMTGQDITEHTGPEGGPVDLDSVLTDWALKTLKAKSTSPLEVLPGISEARKCWSADGGWQDRWITQGLSSQDVSEVAEASRGIVLWYQRQLGAPDPICSEATVAAVVTVLTMARTAAKRKGLDRRVGWFRSALTKRNVALLDDASRELKQAAKFVKGMRETVEADS